MNKENHNRFKAADWYNSFQNIVVGGAGGIGSWLAPFLTRIGHTLYIYDDDTIDQTNMAGQFYNQSQIGIRKTDAVKLNCRALNGANLISTFGRYDKNGLTSPIMITCFDNMAGRKLMFEKWVTQKDRELFLDGRMLAETGMIFCVLPGQEDNYRAELFEDSEVADAPCSLKATSHCGALISVLLTNALNSYLGNKAMKADIRILPFRYDFELPFFTFNEIELTPLEPEPDELTTTA
jgi:hypothetical protein|tara:strand:- start:4609 stop:5319 length:711 start_codon:yes stop_codon:yes gene_type:complete